MFKHKIKINKLSNYIFLDKNKIIVYINKYK